MFLKYFSHLSYNVQITGINFSTSGSQSYCEKTDVEANLNNIKSHISGLYSKIWLKKMKLSQKTVQSHEQM